MEIYLSVNNRAEIITLPVIPPEITVKKGQSSEKFKTADYGWVKIIGETDLKTIGWSSFFPVRDYPFLKSRDIWGFDYVYKIDNWIADKLPIRLIIHTGHGDINMAVSIDTFEYNIGRDGNINYTFEFGEFNLLEDEESEEDELMSEEYNELKALVSNLEERLSNVENSPVYNYIDDNLPSWAKPSVEKAIEKGVIIGVGTDGNGVTIYGLTLCDLKGAVKLDRLGLLD